MIPSPFKTLTDEAEVSGRRNENGKNRAAWKLQNDPDVIAGFAELTFWTTLGQKSGLRPRCQRNAWKTNILWSLAAWVASKSQESQRCSDLTKGGHPGLHLDRSDFPWFLVLKPRAWLLLNCKLKSRHIAKNILTYNMNYCICSLPLLKDPKHEGTAARN